MTWFCPESAKLPVESNLTVEQQGPSGGWTVGWLSHSLGPDIASFLLKLYWISPFNQQAFLYDESKDSYRK